MGSNVEDAKRICRWSVLAPQKYNGDYVFDQVGRLAANILARAGVVARVDPKTGKVTFDERQAEKETVAT